MARIEIRGVSKAFDRVQAVDGVDLTIEDRELLVLLGPSGCGKSTLLRLVAGFERPDSGSILIDGRDVTGWPPRRRKMAMVFQSYALFPHMTVQDNVAFGLRMHRVPADEVQRRIEDKASLLEIGELLKRYPNELSGGQRQRVAVARALVMEPDVLLMDEPLSNLDALLRLQFRAELKRLLQEVRTTTIYVTHDQVEALSLADRTAVMQRGSILQVGPPMDVYDRPAQIFVAQFIGSPPMNVLEGTVAGARDGALHVQVEGGELELEAPEERPAEGARVLVGIRAENLELASDGQGMPVELSVAEPLGSHVLLTVRLGAQPLKVVAGADFQGQRGARLRVKPLEGKIRWLGLAEGGSAAPPKPGPSPDAP